MKIPGIRCEWMLKRFATRDIDGVKFLALRSGFERREAIIAAARVSSGKAPRRLLQPSFFVSVPRFPMLSFGNYNTIPNAVLCYGEFRAGILDHPAPTRLESVDFIKNRKN